MRMRTQVPAITGWLCIMLDFYRTFTCDQNIQESSMKFPSPLNINEVHKGPHAICEQRRP